MRQSPSPQSRRVVGPSVAVVVLLVVFGAVVTVGRWYATMVLDEDRFVVEASDVLRSEPSRRNLASEIVDRIVAAEPAFAIVRAPAESAIAGVLASPVFEPLAEFSARSLHRVLLEADGAPVVIELAPWRDDILAPLEAVAPELADAVPDAVFAPVVLVEANRLPRPPDLVGLVVVAWVGLVAAVVVVGSVVRRSPSAAVAAVGVGILGSGLVALAVSGRIGGSAVAGLGDGGRQEVALMLVGRLVAPLRRWSLAEIAAGGIVAVVGVALAMRTSDAMEEGVRPPPSS